MAKDRTRLNIRNSLRGRNRVDNSRRSNGDTSVGPVRTILPVTTTIDRTAPSVVSDVSLSAFMRALPIDFTAYNLRPNRKVYPFFDNKDVSNFIEKANRVVLDTRAQLQTMITGAISGVNYTGSRILNPVDTSREEVFIYGKKATVLFSEVDETGNTVLYISHLSPRFDFTPAAISPPFSRSFTRDIVGFTSPPVGSGVVAQIPVTAADLTLSLNSVTGAKSGLTANIVSYEHHSGIARIVTVGGDLQNLYPEESSNGQIIFPSAISPTNIRSGQIEILHIKLSDDASSVDNWYSGNTISLVNGFHPGMVANIVSYNGSTRIVRISSPILENNATFNGIAPSSNIIYSIGDSKSPFSILNPRLSHYTTEKGFLAGTLHIPDPKNTTSNRFRVGEKIFSITDNTNNNVDDATSVAEYRFNSAGLDVSTTHIISSTSSVSLTPRPAPIAPPVIPLPPITEPEEIPAPLPIIIDEDDGDRQNRLRRNARPRRQDPTAQSFFVSEEDYPQGMFIPYIDVFFSNKGILPITMQIRPLTNGTPDSNIVLPNAISIMQAEDVKVSANPNAADPNTYTRFTFSSPVYVAPNTEYAFVILTNDFDYDIYVSELGEKIIGTDRIVSEQPYSGSLFKSQNASTYTAIQNEDIMFVIHKCDFYSTGSIILSEKKNITYDSPYYNKKTSSNTHFDAFEVHSDSVELPGTKLTFSFKSVNDDTNTEDSEFTEFKPDTRTILSKRKRIYGPDIFTDSFKMKVDLTTTSTDVSPIISIEKQNLGTLTTIINNMGIDPYRISLVDRGGNYTTQNTTITFTSNTSGDGAQAIPYIKIEPVRTGKIAGLYFESEGFNYFDDVRAIISSTDANVSNAIISVDTETGQAGGPAAARYISKTVTLAPEFDAGDLRVYLTAVKPPEANIQVYYKVHNSYDIDSINEKYWVKMAQRTGEINYSTNLNPIELEFRPSMNSNNIIYTTNTATFDTFNQFKIKIVMSSSDTVLTKIPYIYDMRAIALPADTQ